MNIAPLLLLAITVQATPNSPKLAGTWNLTSDVNDMHSISVCDVTEDGSKITMHCKRAEHASVVSGTIDEKGVHMTAQSSYDGNPTELQFEGTVKDANNVSGTITVSPYNVQGTFSLVRQ